MPDAVKQPRLRARTLRDATVVIYATFVLLAVAIPQSLVNSLAGLKGNDLQETLLRGAEALQKVSEETGITILYARARDAFLGLTGKEDK